MSITVVRSVPPAGRPLRRFLRSTREGQGGGARTAIRLVITSFAALLVTACNPSPRTGLDFSETFPDKLSAWHLLEREGDKLVLNAGLVPYDLNSPLFSDYAHKLRTVLVPPGTAIRYGEDKFDFPIGTVITKTFYYPQAADAQGAAARIAVRKVPEQSQVVSLNLREVRLLETRLLINTASGWVALPYVWNATQTDATLALAGEAFSLELVGDAGHEPFIYMVPDANQCAGCHALDHHKQTLEPIGVKARHVSKDYHYRTGNENQLMHWRRIGLLAGAVASQSVPRNARWDDASSGDIEARARAYLDVNCAHCHSSGAAANTSGLLLDARQTDRAKLGLCKIPIATGRGSGDALFDIVPGAPDESILLHRMTSTEPDVAMPELGRSLVHEEGVALIRAWIASLKGSCALM